jgi:hypothetical protein
VRENIKAGLVAHIALHRAKHGRFVTYFSDPSFSQRQRHMRDRCPDKHRDSTQYSGKKNSHIKARMKDLRQGGK